MNVRSSDTPIIQMLNKALNSIAAQIAFVVHVCRQG